MKENAYTIVTGSQCSITDTISVHNLDTNFQFIFKLRADYLSDLRHNSKIIISQIKF